MYSVVIRKNKSLRESAHFFNEGRMEVVERPAWGGMEKAFCNNVLRRIVDYFAGRFIIDYFGNAPRTVKQERKQKRICRTGDAVSGAWGILPTELLVLILVKLSIVDYLSFSGVCKSWRSASIDFRKYCMEHQQPVIVVRPKYSKKSCVLYNMFDMKSYKTMLPDLPWKKLLGFSCGYLITIDRNLGFWLINLITKHELRFPVLPGHMGDINCSEFPARIFQSTRLSETFMVLFPLKKNYILLYKSGGTSWRRYVLFDTKARIADVKIFDGKIFVLTSDGRLGEFNPKAGPVPKFSKISMPFQVSSNMNLKLVESDNKLYMTVLNSYPYPTLNRHHVLFEIDHETMDRAKQIHDLGAKSLFLSWFSSAVVDTTGWGAGNCVCLLHLSVNKCSFFNLNGKWLGATPVVWDGHSSPYFWYFPSEIWSISCVSDEFGA
ncbi:uncharacterized protein LOC135150629 [Daucus carota subsp. sativus]|uniref:uncharacterized protein LOC135150629 n=1 Tax=Daucus carota subsp. sativus TaxID=79200 RepID=UPI0030836624